MTDRDLDRLKSLPVPPARQEARARALGAALVAFEQDGIRPKGLPPGDRPIDVSTSRRRSWMRRPEMMAMAAAIALVAVGVPMLTGLLRPEQSEYPDLSKLDGTRIAHQGALQRPVDGPAPSPAAKSRRGDHDVAALPVPPQAAQPTAPRVAVPVAPPAQTVMPDVVVEDGARRQSAVEPARRADESGRRLAEQRARQNQMAEIAERREQASVEAKRRGAMGADAPAAPLPARPDEKTAGGLALRGPQNQRVVTGFLQPGPDHGSPQFQPAEGRDRFASAESNPVKSVATEPVSTFSIDVDTASYSLARRALNAGRLPPKEAVRVEEMINYFPYAWPAPESADPPFRPTVTVLPAPWNAANKLVHIAIKGYRLQAAERPRANLVFLVDVSGSMAPADRLPLLKNAFRMLVDELRPDDTVAIVTYASGSDIRLHPTRVANKPSILAAINSLVAGGSTHGAAGIQDAYRVAETSFDRAAVNRVILATDGDWNVGITDRGQLKSFIEAKRQTGIYLSVLGVGMGNHNDALMQALAQNGNGVAAYIDTLAEARKVLVEEASSTLFPIAEDVKIQVEFNPARVAEYRLIGYETRALRREDFNNDKVDAGDIGSGHTVTAIYEITPVGAKVVADGLRYGNQANDPVLLHADEIVHEADRVIARGHVELRYRGGELRADELVLDRATGNVTATNGRVFDRRHNTDDRFSKLQMSEAVRAPVARLLSQRAAAGGKASGEAIAKTTETGSEYAFLKLRYKLPSEDVSRLIELPIGPALERRDMADVATDVRFSVAVAGFGQLLREASHLGSWGLDEVIALANGARGDDSYGYRAEFVNIARLAKSARRP